MTQQQLSPQQRAANFNSLTRQNIQTLPSVSGQEGDSVSFNLPKVRLSSRIRLLFEATLNATHNSETTYTPAAFAPYTAIRRVTVDLNNGFAPFSVTGRQLYLYSLMRQNATILTPALAGRNKVVQNNTAAAGGANNTVRFVADLPLTLNERDPIGLIITQNQETTVSVVVDVDSAAKLADGTSGYTYTLSNIKITPIVESFSIPPTPAAFPDTSVLKLVQASTSTINGNGLHTVSLPTGMTYRKLIMLVEDSAGAGISDDSGITGDIMITFNQADTPYKINPKALAAINHEQFNMPLPNGVYGFDFSYQGISNYGGGRDYIDTEKLTEFWLQFNPNQSGQVTCVYEVLSTLK